MATSLQVTELKSCNCTAGIPGSLPKKIYNAAKKGEISEITEWLKTFSKSVNSTSQLNRTISHFACLEDQPHVLEVMMRKNACLNTRDSAGETPLMIAVKKGHKTCVELLLKSRSSSRGGVCSVDVDVLTYYTGKTTLNLAQEELERGDKKNIFQDIVHMLSKETNLTPTSNSENEQEEPLMPQTQNKNNQVDISSKKSLVTRIRDDVQKRSKSLWNESKLLCKKIKSLFPLLLDLSPWIMQLVLIIITLYFVTGCRISIELVVPCSTNHSISVMSSVAYPLNLNSIQHVASDCDNNNKIMSLKGDISFELYLVAIVASVTIATLVWIIVYHSNGKCEGMNILYVDLPVLFFNSYLWLCTSCNLVLVVIKLKGFLNFNILSNLNAHFCANMPSCIIKDFVMKEPYTVPLYVCCYLGFVIFFLSILHLFILYSKSFLSKPKETVV